MKTQGIAVLKLILWCSTQI